MKVHCVTAATQLRVEHDYPQLDAKLPARGLAERVKFLVKQNLSWNSPAIWPAEFRRTEWYSEAELAWYFGPSCHQCQSPHPTIFPTTRKTGYKALTEGQYCNRQRQNCCVGRFSSQLATNIMIFRLIFKLSTGLGYHNRKPWAACRLSWGMPACPAISGIPSHDGPSSSQMIFDNSHNETSYGNYTNMGQHGVINNHYQAPRSNPLGMPASCSSINVFNE